MTGGGLHAISEQPASAPPAPAATGHHRTARRGVIVSVPGEVKLMNSKAASMLGLPAPQGENIYKFMRPRRCSTTSSRAIPISWIRKQFPGIRFAVLFLFGHVPDQRGLRGVTFREARRMRDSRPASPGRRPCTRLTASLGIRPAHGGHRSGQNHRAGNTRAHPRRKRHGGKELFAVDP